MFASDNATQGTVRVRRSADQLLQAMEGFAPSQPDQIVPDDRLTLPPRPE